MVPANKAKSDAIRAEALLKQYRRLAGETREDKLSNFDIVDLLADLMHACDRRGIDFDAMANQAYSHYTAEVYGED